MQQGSTHDVLPVSPPNSNTPLSLEIRQLVHHQIGTTIAICSGLSSIARLAIDDGYSTVATLEELELLANDMKSRLTALHSQLMSV